jgi:hypothetical protein
MGIAAAKAQDLGIIGSGFRESEDSVSEAPHTPAIRRQTTGKGCAGPDRNVALQIGADSARDSTDYHARVVTWGKSDVVAER